MDFWAAFGRAGGLIVAATVVCAFAAQAEDVAFQAAIQKEVVEGDLAGAIKAYEGLAKSGNRTIAARALLRIGRCHEKLGDGQAAAYYERIVREFGDQIEARDASERLAQLGGTAKAAAPAGWYNGDWQSGIPGLANWFVSDEECARVYDDFVVPEGGWTVTAVFSNNRMDFSGVTYAAWEIRSGMSAGRMGRRVAGGISRATQRVIPGNGPFPRDAMVGYRIQVDGLRVQLAPGRYWLNVAAVGRGMSYISATRGRNARGDPPGNNGRALYRGPGADSLVEAESLEARGQLGIGRDFSQGVIAAQK